jgi:glutamate carboxypeptidase
MTTPMKREDEVASWLEERGPAMREEIASLVEINSFTENRDGGLRVGEVLSKRTFFVEGMEHRAVPSQRFADHHVFRSKGDDSRTPVALIGHLDTVFPPGTFEGYREDGELARGPGVLDMKGGLVVVAFALRAIAATCGLRAIAPIRLVVVADEEVGSPEGQEVIREAIQGAKGALVFEAGRRNDVIITRRKGTGGMKAEATGKAAHAGANHKEGKNAIWAVARFVDRAQALTDYSRGVTINVGRIEGGTSKNTVPDRATCDLDLRFETTADGDALVLALKTVAAEVGVEGTRITLSGGIARVPLERSEASVALMKSYAKWANASGLGDGEAPLIGGGSDASTSSAMGIASIDGLGPRGTGFHTKDELIEIKSLVPKAQALARFLLHYGL